MMVHISQKMNIISQIFFLQKLGVSRHQGWHILLILLYKKFKVDNDFQVSCLRFHAVNAEYQNDWENILDFNTIFPYF